MHATHNTLSENIRAQSADLLTEVSRGIDRQLWLVESHTPAKADVRTVQK